MLNKSNPIGVMDSGIGGLTVVRELQRILPGEDIIYFGDHLRLRCKLPSEAEVMVKLALGHSAVPTPGHRVHLHAPPQHMRVYL